MAHGFALSMAATDTASGGLEFTGFHNLRLPGFDTAQDCQCHVSSVTSPTGCTD